MKRTVLAALILLLGGTLFSQTIELNRLYQTYRGEEDVITLYIPGFLCRMAGNIADLDHAERELLRSIRSVRVQVIENREINDEVNFVSEFNHRGIKPDYHLMLEVHDGDEDVLILAREKDEAVTELIILVGGDENVLVWIRGRMDHDLMKSLYEVTGIEHCRYTREI